MRCYTRFGPFPQSIENTYGFKGSCWGHNAGGASCDGICRIELRKLITSTPDSGCKEL